MKPVVIWNRRAGHGGRSGEALAQRLAKLRNLEILAPDSLEELERVAVDLRSSGIARVGVLGGDGTLHAVMSALDRAASSEPLPTFALLGGGTLNTVAASVGTKRLPLSVALSTFASLPMDDRALTTTRATMRCDGLLGSLFGVGVVETFLRAYYAGGKPTSASAARLLTTAAVESVFGGKTFESFTERKTLSVTLDEGEVLEARPTLTVTAGTIADLGLGFRPFHRVIDNPHTIHLLRFHGEASDVVRALPRIRLARELPTHVADERTTLGFTIRSDEERIGFMCDGDLYSHDGSELRVERGPIVRYATLETSEG